jgi:O-antigen/teichoic acid export membrane protein
MFNFMTSWVDLWGKFSSRLLQKISPNSVDLKKFLAKAIAGTFSIRVLNIGLAYAVSLILTHLLGADGYGSFVFALTLIGFLQIPSLLGTTSLITREVAIYKTQEKWGLAKGIVRWADLNVLGLSLGLSLITGLIIWQFHGQLKVNNISIILISLILLPISNCLKIRESQLHAIGHIIKGQLPDVIIRPILLIVAFTIFYFLFREEFNPTWAMVIYVAATAICLVVMILTVVRVIPSQIKEAKPEYNRRFWFQEALPMLLINSMYLINNETDTLMLGVLSSSTAVGIYSIANRGASLMNFILSVFNVSIAPTIASLYAAGDKQRLQKLVKQSANLVFLSSLPIALLLIIFSKWFLGMFGAEFIQGQAVLSILCLGKLINASTGAVALLLNMTGYQKYTFMGVAVSAILNVILNAAFIPQWGAEGAAIATAISTVIWNILLVIFVQKRLNINMNPLSFTK